MAKKAKKASLETYKKKRDFKKTPEPKPVKKESKPVQTKGLGKGRIFVIQKHDASHLNYDFRLEIDGVLMSWAVPKGPSLDPGQKRLAVLTEDHPLDYAKFEGIIPQGEYGGGTVMVWDTGKYFNLKLNEDGSEVPMSEAAETGHLEFWLEGKKLKGVFALVKTRMAGKQQQWLLIKMKDELAQPGSDILEEMPDSAKTGRTLEEIAEDKKKVYHSKEH